MQARDEGAARAYVARLVAQRPRTVAEVERRLADKGFPPDVARAVLAFAQETGIVDDALFARLYAEDRLLSRPCARELLAKELNDRGVEASLAKRAAQVALPGLTEADLAQRALAARLPVLGQLDPEVARKRAAAFLLRRGFSLDLVREVVTQAFGEAWTPG